MDCYQYHHCCKPAYTVSHVDWRGTGDYREHTGFHGEQRHLHPDNNMDQVSQQSVVSSSSDCQAWVLAMLWLSL